MTHATTNDDVTIGIDLGDRQSHICVLDADGEVLETGTVPTTQAGMRRRFERCDHARIAIEAGGQSAWVAELLEGLGHDVIVANARRLRLIYANDKQCRWSGATKSTRTRSPASRDWIPGSSTRSSTAIAAFGSTWPGRGQGMNSCRHARR